MSQVDQRRASGTDERPVPDEAPLEPAAADHGGGSLRMLGAVAVLVVGAVHLEQYFASGYSGVATIGPLFALNFAGATVIGAGLLLPLGGLRRLRPLLALGGIGLAATSFVFLFVSESQPLFGFREHGYRAAILIALVAEAAAVILLAGYLVARRRRG